VKSTGRILELVFFKHLTWTHHLGEMPAVSLSIVFILAATAFTGSVKAAIECSQLPISDKIYMDLLMTDRLFNRNDRHKVIVKTVAVTFFYIKYIE